MGSGISPLLHPGRRFYLSFSSLYPPSVKEGEEIKDTISYPIRSFSPLLSLKAPQTLSGEAKYAVMGKMSQRNWVEPEGNSSLLMYAELPRFLLSRGW